MSAPTTDLEKQEKRHRGPLTGIIAVVVFALALLLLLVAYVVYQGDSPEGAVQQIDGRTGEVTSSDIDAGSAADPASEVTGAANTATAPATAPIAETTSDLLVTESATAPLTTTEPRPLDAVLAR